MKLAVLGGGNGSFAAAADLADQGHEVRLWRRDAASVNALKENGQAVVLKDHKSCQRTTRYRIKTGTAFNRWSGGVFTPWKPW